jgi:hypothetical protein
MANMMQNSYVLIGSVTPMSIVSWCGHGWLSGGYTVGTLSYGEEEFNSNSACST